MTTEHELDDETDFWVTSMFGFRTQKPLVTIKLRDIAVQVSPSKAREMGYMLLSVAAASEQDGFMINYFRDTLGLGDEAATWLMAELRKWREISSHEP